MESKLNDCCRQSKNLYEVYDPRPKFTVTKCRVCGSRHYTLKVLPGTFKAFEEKTNV
jgi:hypothetical protein